MLFDPTNPIVALCAEGMMAENSENNGIARDLFKQAWEQAQSDLERCIAAHYMARHQKSAMEKLHWDQTSLEFALNVKDTDIKGFLPSLYLNIAKCYEDMGLYVKAAEFYELAKSRSAFLNDDGYGQMIRNGIENGFRRMSAKI